MSEPVPSSEKINNSAYGKILADALLASAETRKIEPRRNLYLDVNQTRYCYLILEGYFGLYRKSDDRLLAIVTVPAVVGLSGMVTASSSVYLKALVPSVAGKISLTLVEEIIKEKGLWEILARYLMHLSERLFIASEQLTSPNAFESVCIQLKELMKEDESIRLNITAERYIRDKTELSRSRIMSILSELKKSGHIELDKGILEHISKPL
ncbi:helix-turn-helix domain-containing protein [Enterobacter bugandensis]